MMKPRMFTIASLVGRFLVCLVFAYLVYRLISVYYYQTVLGVASACMGMILDFSRLPFEVGEFRLRFLAEKTMVHAGEAVRIGLSFGQKDIEKLYHIVGTTPFFLAVLLTLSVSWKRLALLLAVMVFFQLATMTVTLMDMTFFFAGKDPLISAYLGEWYAWPVVVTMIGFIQLFAFVYLPKALPFFMGYYLWEKEGHALKQTLFDTVSKPAANSGCTV